MSVWADIKGCLRDLLFKGIVRFTNTTPSTSTTTGAVQVTGGVGIQGAVVVGSGIGIIGNRVAVPSNIQNLTATTAISPSAEILLVNSSANITLTAAPSISNGLNGQCISIINVGIGKITLQDAGKLSGSNLRLTANSIAIASRQSIQFVYSASIGDWVQTGFSAVL